METFEEWKNTTGSQIWVDKTDPGTNKIKTEKIASGATIDISPEDRRRNQVRTVDKKLDWFSNGALSPVELIETEADYASIKESPNSLSETEIFDLLKLNTTPLKKKLEDIDSAFILQKLYDYVQSDEGQQDEKMSAPKAKAIETRYRELSPATTGVKVSQTIEEVIKKPIQPI